MTSRPTVGVLALQGDVREHVAALESCGADARRVRRPAELDVVDALVIPGGESTTIDKLTRAFDLRDPLRERLAAGMPAYGSCAGMILLADRLVDAAQGQQTLGGLDVLVRRNAFGRQVQSFEEDLEVDGVTDGSAIDGGATDEGGRMRAVFIRAPWVEEAGTAVQVLARVRTGPAAGRVVVVRQGNLLATSFHPEMTGDLRIHRYFVRLLQQS